MPAQAPVRSPAVGEPAPGFDLPELRGGRLRLEDLRGRPLILTFMRHAGWLTCRAHLVKMLHRRERIYELGGEVVVVVHDEPRRVRGGLLRGLDVPFRVVVDLEREAYHAYGLGRASFAATYLSRWALRDYGERLRGRGRGMLPGRDPRQLGGDFVVDPNGLVAYSHPQAHIADRPPVGVLIRELAAAAGASAG